MVWSFISSPVPDGSPQNVGGFPLVIDAIRVTWEDVVQADQNGIIAGYVVFYTESSVFDEKNLTVGREKREANLTGLKIHTLYNIRVLAFTIKGRGPKSAAVSIRTLEGKVQSGKQTRVGLKTNFQPVLLFSSVIVVRSVGSSFLCCFIMWARNEPTLT